jgi:hypothetical protein
MKIVLICFVLLLLSCNGPQERKPPAASGIWIPRMVDWKEGDFSTYYFVDGLTAIVISSVQKNLHDSIYFATEPGFIIKKGIVGPMPDGRFSIGGKTIYRVFKLAGVDWREPFQDTVTIGEGGRSMVINGIAYIQGDRYTQESKQRIHDLATKMVPDIESHPEKFE